MAVSPQNMDSDMAYLDKLAAGTVITPGSPFPSIYIPIDDPDRLTSEQRRIIIAKAEQNRMSKLLEERLLDLTPPPMPYEEWIIESRHREDKIRNELELAGCPPCYPAAFQIPLDNSLPEPHFSAAKGFKAGDVVLAGQIWMWEEFRRRQKIIRRNFPGSRWEEYVSQVKTRREAQGLLPHDVELEPDLAKQQSALQTWAEFSDYNLRQLAMHTTNKKIREQKLEETKLAVQAQTPVNGSLLDERYVLAAEYQVDVCSRDIEKTTMLQPWIEFEWQRLLELKTADSKATGERQDYADHQATPPVVPQRSQSGGKRKRPSEAAHVKRSRAKIAPVDNTTLTSESKVTSGRRSTRAVSNQSNIDQDGRPAVPVLSDQQRRREVGTVPLKRRGRIRESSQGDYLYKHRSNGWMDNSVTARTDYLSRRNPKGCRNSERMAQRPPIYYTR